jgi:hypothetical protein
MTGRRVLGVNEVIRFNYIDQILAIANNWPGIKPK